MEFIFDEIKIDKLDKSFITHWNTKESSLFQPERISSDLYNIDLENSFDIIRNDLNRLQIYLFEYINSNKIFEYKVKGFNANDVKEEYREKFKKFLINKILSTEKYKNPKDFLENLEFWYYNGILGYDCK